MKAIEINFPFDKIDAIAEKESWRKEIYRPNYYIHKWWARRLGSVFRACVLGSLLNEDKNIWEEFYNVHDLKNFVVLDPFMGSGTTLGECAKLGVKPIGCDINPVSTFVVKQSLSRIKKELLLETYNFLMEKVGKKITSYYKTIDPKNNEECQALYYFWVNFVVTPEGEEIPLFKSYVFSKNAYPKRVPRAHIICPHCWTVSKSTYDCTNFQCSNCNNIFNPQKGSCDNQTVQSKISQKKYKIQQLIADSGDLPKSKMYAIMAINSDGKKFYLTPTYFDFKIFNKAELELKSIEKILPVSKIRYGYNTKQALSYNYKYWHQFFNARQQLCLTILYKEILNIKDQNLREHFICLFSSTLEFNNLFCSFKGEGTGAVRHIFSNHIFKPEKAPLENNVWGTRKSSGSFSSLFFSKLIKAKEYLENPFELHLDNNTKSAQKKVCSKGINVNVVDSYKDFIKDQSSALVLNGDSSCLPIPSECVDAVVTDPPYFDFIHYSELSDFFFYWLQAGLKNDYPYFQFQHSGNLGEVQQSDVDNFCEKLEKVFRECFRCLKQKGLMLFSFHHSKPNAWNAIYRCIKNSGFIISAFYPVKAEISVSKVKSASKNPINIDGIIVCKKCKPDSSKKVECIWEFAKKKTRDCINRFNQVNRKLSNADQFVMLCGYIMLAASLQNLNDIETFLNHAKECQLDFTENSKDYNNTIDKQDSFYFVD